MKHTFLLFHSNAMENKSDKFVFKLPIGKQVYTITVNSDKEEIYRKDSRMFSEERGHYEQSYPHLSYERYTAVALLDFAVQVIQLQTQKDQSLYEETVNRLSGELNNLLNSAR